MTSILPSLLAQQPVLIMGSIGGTIFVFLVIALIVVGSSANGLRKLNEILKANQKNPTGSNQPTRVKLNESFTEFFANIKKMAEEQNRQGKRIQLRQNRSALRTGLKPPAIRSKAPAQSKHTVSIHAPSRSSTANARGRRSSMAATAEVPRPVVTASRIDQKNAEQSTRDRTASASVNPDAHYDEIHHSVVADKFRRALTGKSVRAAIVLKEILDKPVGLRDMPSGQ